MEKKPYVLFGLGALVGAAVGAALGIMFAPDKGSETRKLVGDWMKEKSREGKDVLEAKRVQIAAAAQAGRKAYEEVHNQRKEPAHT